MLDLGRPHGDMYEVAIWEDMLKVEGDELYYAYLVDNQAIVIPETIDAIRALTGIELDVKKSTSQTNASLGIRGVSFEINKSRKMKPITIIKANGEKVPFEIDKLKNSLKSSGASEITQNIALKISKTLYEGMHTKEIYKKPFQCYEKRLVLQQRSTN